MTDPKRRDPVPADYDPAHAAAVIETLDQHGARLDGAHRVLSDHEGKLNGLDERLDAMDGRHLTAAERLLEHRTELDEHGKRFDRVAEDLRRDVASLDHHDKRLTKLAGRVDNANRIITETRGELTGHRAEVTKLRELVVAIDDHQTEHCGSFLTATNHVNELTATVNDLTNHVHHIGDRLDAAEAYRQLGDDEATISRTRFANVSELAETIYARVRAADAWMMQAVDPAPVDVASHHARIAAVLATVHATQCVDDRRREDELRAAADSLDEWRVEIEAYGKHRRHPGGYRFEQCPAEPCVNLTERRRAAYEQSRGTVPTRSTFTDDELATVLDVHRTRHAKSTHRALAECTLAPCVEVDQLSREAFAQRVSRQPGAGYVARPAGSAFATEAADAMQAASNPPNAAALAEVADAHRVHGMPGAAGHRQEFADCTNGHCASVTRAMRYIYANSTIGLRFAIISHAMNDHGLSFWACEVEPCCSADAGNREQYAGTVRIDQDEARVEMRVGPAVEFHGGPGMAVHIAADGSTVHQGKAAECTASGCMQARAGRDDSMADMEAAAIEQAWTAHAGHHRQGERPYVGLDSFEACIIAPCRDIDVMARVAYAGEHYVAAAANDLEAAWNIHGEHKPTDGPSSFESCDLMPCYGLSVADRETFASERGEPNDPHREG